MSRFLLFASIFILAIPVFSHEKRCSKDFHTDNLICSTDTIPINNGNDEGGLGGPKSPGFVPIGCELLDSGTDIVFTFYDDLGYVTISVINLSANEVDSRIIDSQLGIVFFSFSGNPGFYQIIITSSGGGTYYGHFSL